MTFQTIRLGRERYVLLKERDFERLRDQASPRQLKRLTRQDRGDIAEAKRRESEPSIPLRDIIKTLGPTRSPVKLKRG